jgi:hypothetical protein
LYEIIGMGHWNSIGPGWSESKALDFYLRGGCSFRISAVTSLILNDFMVFRNLNTYQDSISNGPAPLPSKYFPIHRQSCIILPSDAI